MESSPKVSVIIPLYNRERYIAETVKSVLDQTYKNIELIVVDDGSTDNSRNIIETFSERITILEHTKKVNKGQSASINLGIRHSSGKYIAILDSDDLFAPEKIQAQVLFLEENEDIGLVYSNGFVIDSSGKTLYHFYSDAPYETSDPSKVLMNCYFLLPNNALMRRSALNAAGLFDEKLRSGQDHDMAIRMAEVTKLAYIEKDLFYYRKHAQSISARNAGLRWHNGFIILRKASARYNYPFRVICKRRAVLHFRLAQIYVENNNFSRASLHFLAAGLIDPLRALKVILGKESTGGLH